MSRHASEQLRKLARQAWVAGIYRWLIGVAFLYVSFSALPDHKYVLGLGYLYINACIGNVMLMFNVVGAQQSAVTDRGERKTRHTILLAAERAGDGYRDLSDPEFWGAVEARMEAERAESEAYLDPPLGRFTAFGLATLALIWELAASIFGVALVAALTEGY